MRRVVVPGGELELAQLLDTFPGGVEQVEGGFAVYTDDAGERALRERFDVTSESFAEGWEEAWREFHHGIVVGAFWIGPPWEEATDDVTPIVIDPGRAFGTGAHATTRLTLELLQKLGPGGDARGNVRSGESESVVLEIRDGVAPKQTQRPGRSRDNPLLPVPPRASLLDVGCGSGVLSIAAAKLGFGPIVAIDIDDDSVDIARANARVNDVELDAYRSDALTDDLPSADVVVANVALDVIERLLPRLDARLAITSGYLERDDPRVTGWRRVERDDREGWAADLYERV